MGGGLIDGRGKEAAHASYPRRLQEEGTMGSNVTNKLEFVRLLLKRIRIGRYHQLASSHFGTLSCKVYRTSCYKVFIDHR
jgi:hypothetical protein